jgi:hypothetical protein
VSDRPNDGQPVDEAPEPSEDDWAAEIMRLRAARGADLAARLAEEGDKEPPVDP